jgi:hypothetical protein
LNLGRSTGIKTGQRFKIDEINGILEITAVEPDKSRAKIIKGRTAIDIGLRVQVLPEPKSD